MAFVRIRNILKPGQPGTRKLLRQYGDRLVCVRYRYDEEQKRRIKTVELVVDETTWSPPAFNLKPDQSVYLKVDLHETAVRDMVKKQGGRWHPDLRLWSLSFKAVSALGYQHRIVPDPLLSDHQSTEDEPAY